MKVQLSMLALGFIALSTSAAQWQKVTSEKELTSLFSGTSMETMLTDKVKSTAIFNADGTGEVIAWGDTFQRTWKIENQQACVDISGNFQCFTIEKNLDKAGEYQVTQTQTKAKNIIQIAGAKIASAKDLSKNSSKAITPTAEELAAKLSNPTSPVMTLGNHVDYVSFDGDIDGASDQSTMRYVFQTVFPFKLKDEKGNSNGVVFFRPTVPVLFNEPIPQASGGFSDQDFSLGDIGFDLSWGTTEKSGLIWGGGMIATMPTATKDTAGKDLWAAGPEVLIGTIGKWGTVGGLLSHQWDFAGSGDSDINSTSFAYWYAFPLGGGWQFAAGPNITYDHTKESNNALSLPVGLGIAKTQVLMGRPWKFQLQYWNYIERDDNYAAQHQLRISISPVVSAPWNK